MPFPNSPVFPGMSFDVSFNSHQLLYIFLAAILTIRLIRVRLVRYQRASQHANMERPLSFDQMETIVKHMHLYEFPWLSKTGYYIVTLHMFGAPSISKILFGSRIMKLSPDNRYYDSDRLVRRFFELGVNTKGGKAALKRFNDVHGKYKAIENIDMIYGIAKMVEGPIQTVNTYGWRKLLPVEEEAIFQYWVGHDESVARRMHIKDLPKSMEELQAFVRDFEATRVAYSSDNETIASASFFGAATSSYPKCTRPLLQRIISTQLDQNLRTALNFPTPSASLHLMVDMGLHVFAGISRWLLLPRITAKPLPRMSAKETNTSIGEQLSVKKIDSNRGSLVCPMMKKIDSNGSSLVCPMTKKIDSNGSSLVCPML